MKDKKTHKKKKTRQEESDRKRKRGEAVWHTPGQQQLESESLTVYAQPLESVLQSKYSVRGLWNQEKHLLSIHWKQD